MTDVNSSINSAALQPREYHEGVPHYSYDYQPGHFALPSISKPFQFQQPPIYEQFSLPQQSLMGQHSDKKKRPRRKHDEIERVYYCNFKGCAKGYGTLNHLNAHVSTQKHGEKRRPEEFKDIRAKLRERKKKSQEYSKLQRKMARGFVQSNVYAPPTPTTPTTQSNMAGQPQSPLGFEYPYHLRNGGPSANNGPYTPSYGSFAYGSVPPPPAVYSNSYEEWKSVSENNSPLHGTGQTTTQTISHHPSPNNVYGFEPNGGSSSGHYLSYNYSMPLPTPEESSHKHVDL